MALPSPPRTLSSLSAGEGWFLGFVLTVGVSALTYTLLLAALWTLSGTIFDSKRAPSNHGPTPARAASKPAS